MTNPPDISWTDFMLATYHQCQFDTSGELHCIDGPAALWGSDPVWYYHGDVHDFNEWCDLVNISDTAKALLLLKYNKDRGPVSLAS